MPYIGNTIRAADDYRLIDDISSGFNGNAKTFALQVAGSAPVPFPKSPQQVLISVNGVIQEPDPTGTSGFNLVGTNIVFSSAPTNGHAFFGIIYATADYLNAGGNFPAGSLGAPSITFIGDENTGLFRKGGGSIGFVADATEIANTDSNGLTISSGNLIIPDSIIHNADSNTKIRFPAADTVSVETNGAEALRIDSSGRLIVGAVSSNNVGAFGGAALQVEGLTAATSAFSIIRHSADTVGPSILMGKTRGTSDGATTVVQNNDVVARIIAFGADGTDTESSLGAIQFDVDGTPGSNDMPGRIVFSTTPDGSATYTERMRIDSSGNVGINTISPDQLLHIAASSNPLIRIENTDDSLVGDQLIGGIEFEKQDPSGAGVGVAGSIKCRSGSSNGADAYIAFSTSSSTVNNAERLRIDPSGFIHHKFTSDNSSTAEGLFINNKQNSTGNNASLIFSNDSGERKKAAIALIDTGNYGAGDLAFALDAADSGALHLTNDEKMRIDISGRLLVGGSSSVLAWNQNNRFQVQGTGWESAGGAILKLSNNNNSPNLIFAASRGTSPGTAVQNGDHLGFIVFNGDDGTDIETVGAFIRAKIDGTVSSNRIDTQLDFATHNNGSTAERVRIHPTGEVTIPSGVVLGTAIDSHGAINTLDDYEEGTYVPVVKPNSGASAFTYSTDYELRSPHASGNTDTVAYTKIGNRVYLSFSLYFNTTGTDRVNISLPLAIRNNDYQCAGTCGYFTVAGAYGVTFIGNGLNSIDLMENDANGGHPNLSYALNTEIYLNFHYETN